MVGFGRKGHGKRHDIASSKDHKGDIYESLIGALHALTAANVTVDTQTLHDAISAAIIGMDWQSTIIRFEAMVTNEPVAPSDGDRYISTEAGTIPSTTQAVLVDDVCQWDTGTSLWIITTPEDGWAVQETGVDPNIAWWYSGVAWRKIGTMVDHANLLNVTSNQHHNELHDIDSTSVHNGVIGAVLNELVKFDVDGLPAVSKLKHIFVSRAVPATGLDYIEIGKFTQAQGSFAMLVAVSSLDAAPSLSGADLYYIVGMYDETAAAWQLAYPLQTIEPHSQLCVMIDDDELHLRLIAITSTVSPVNMSVQVIELGVGDAVFTAASGTGTMGMPGTIFASTLISQVNGLVQIHAEMNMNSEKISGVADPSAAQDVDTQNARDAAITTHTGLPNAHHSQLHAPSHKDGGGDDLDVSELAGALGGAGEIPETDGAAVGWVDPDGRYDPKSHGISDNTKHTGSLVNDNIALGDANGLVKDSGVAIGTIVGGLNYQGTWNANTNTPTLADGTGTKGHFYEVSVAGIQDLGSGSITFGIGDWCVHNGSIWQKVDRVDIVTSVFSRVGAIVALASDYDASQIDNDSGVAGAFVDDALNTLDAETIYRGTSFPGSPSDGDMFNRTDLDMVFRYDGGRSKWLSEHSEMFICGRGTVNPLVDVYGIVSGAAMSSTNGIRMQRNGTIVSVTVQNLNSVTRTIDYRVNNSTSNRIQLALAAAVGGKVTNADQDFSADDLIQVLALIAAGNAMAEMIATFEVKWRA